MVSVDREKAGQLFQTALAKALSDGELPVDWIRRTDEVARAPAKTFVPMLGTALLAKATNRHVDVFSLKKGTGHKSYSARSLAKDVFVPLCKRAGIDIRTTGAEPLNNQPFFHSVRVSTDIQVKKGSEDALAYLCECLEQADFLENESALDALAAFLRARIRATQDQGVVVIEGAPIAANLLIESVVAFVEQHKEGGKIGQALVAAVFDLAHEDVQTRKINDPGRGWPGDVGTFAGKKQTQSVEVKQRPFQPSEVLQFIDRVAEAKVPYGRVAALDQAGVPLDREELATRAWGRGVHLDIVEGLRALLLEVLRNKAAPPDEALADLPRLGLRRLREIEASDDAQRAWVEATTT